MTDFPVTIAALWIPGVPRTKGSLDPRMQDTPQSKAWRAHVAASVCASRKLGCAYGRHGHLAVDGRFTVRLGFVLPDETWLRGNDVDKLARNVLDAIGCSRRDDAHLIADDSMVLNLHVQKTPAMGTPTGLQMLVVQEA